MMKIYQAFIGAEQRAWVSAAAEPWDASQNAQPDQREYELFKQVAARESAEGEGRPWGLVSWKFEHKSRVPLEHFHRACIALFDAGFDCVYLNPMIGNEALHMSVWDQGFVVHPGMREIATFLEQRLGLVLSDNRAAARTFAFCNYFVAHPWFWDRYFEFVDSALAALEAEARAGSEVGKAYAANATYSRSPTAGMRPFVIERLFAAFVDHEKTFRVAQVQIPANVYRDKFGVELGAYLLHLATLKRRSIDESSFDLLIEWDKLRRELVQAGMLGTVVGQLDDLDVFLLGEGARAARRAWSV